MNWLMNRLPVPLQATLRMRMFGLWKIPLIFYVRPSVVAINQEKIIVKIPFRRRNKNHLGSMYFGTMCVGADCSGGLLAMKLIDESPSGISLIFKDLTADFLKRAEGDTYFTCTQGKEIGALVEATSRSDERQEMVMTIVATVPEKFGEEPVATFDMTLSLKKR